MFRTSGVGISFDLPLEAIRAWEHHVVGVEPFYGARIYAQAAAVMGIAGLEFPAKHCMGDEHGRELNYGIASIYQFQPHFQALLEFDGPHAFTGAEAGTKVLNISPGIKSLHGHHWQMGVSLAAPVTKAKE